MLVSVLRSNKRKLWRGAALLLVTGMAAGCSSQSARFGGVDDIFTGSTANQRQIINDGGQAYPGDAAPVAAAPVDAVSTGSVSRGSLAPVSAQPTMAAATPAPVAPAPAVSAPRPQAAPTLASAASTPARPAEPQMASEAADPAGWSRAGGTQVTVREGETVYNLSRRFGVPANVIARVNGLPEGGGLQTGQKIVIPTYVYSNKAPVSAPDNHPAVADAKSSTGTRYDVPADKVPVPSRAPQQTLAVLPQPPKVKEAAVPAATDPNAANSSGQSKPKSVAGAYTVQDGDTLTRVAKKTGVSVAALKAANGMQDGVLRIGQTLKVPAAGQAPAVAQAAPGVDKTATGAVPPVAKPTQQEAVAAYTPPRKTDKVIEQAESAAVAAPSSTGIDRMRWPVRGKVISSYGKGAGRDGIDIAVPEGTPVKAAENGVVIYAGDGLKEFGNTVLVRHDNGLVTVYGHASELKVQRGQKVKRGDDIAVSGMSGSANAPKLHFEVRKNSAPVDPTTYLE
jgi:murein DD-endopeptidase MepM/ murein hydrolase activator NlpD